MWKLFTSRQKSSPDRKPSNDQQPQLNLSQLTQEIQKQALSLFQQITASEQILKKSYSITPHEQSLTNTFQQLIATIQGLLTIIQQLRAEYDDIQQQAQQGRQAQQRLSNHQNIITAIQQSHSQQVTSIYEQKKAREQQLNQRILTLQQQKQQLSTNCQQIANKVTLLYEDNHNLKTEIDTLIQQKQELEHKLSRIQDRQRALMNSFEPIPTRKPIDPSHLQLEQLLYYSKIRQKIVQYLDIHSIYHLQRSGKFYHRMLKKYQPIKIYQHFKQQAENNRNQQIQTAKMYEKIYQLFPSENIKINAFKYLHFRIKPATYILPFLQEEQAQSKKEIQQEKEKEKGRFRWGGLWGSEKKVEKKQEKFSLSALKNEEQFKKTEQRLETTFKNILLLEMPSDLQYFSQNMQKQLQQLKNDLVHSRHGKNGHLEWTSQLCCLSRYMYHEINQLYNLLQVIFGQLLKKNKALTLLTQDYEYLKQNQIVLRNLIENLSTDKGVIQKKFILLENQLLKKNLQKQSLNTQLQKSITEEQTHKKKYNQLLIQHNHCKTSIDKLTQSRKHLEFKLSQIHDELDHLQKLPSKSRKNSVGSLGSQQN